MTESAEAVKCRTAETAKCQAEVAAERRSGAVLQAWFCVLPRRIASTVLRVAEAAKPTKCHAAVAAKPTKCRAVMAAQADGVLYI